MDSPTPAITLRELDRRINDGIDVRLLWNSHTGDVSVAVVDSRGGEAIEFEIDAACALDAFRHPYAYAAERAVNHSSGQPAALRRTR